MISLAEKLARLASGHSSLRAGLGPRPVRGEAAEGGAVGRPVGGPMGLLGTAGVPFSSEAPGDTGSQGLPGPRSTAAAERGLPNPTQTIHGPVQLVEELHGPGFRLGKIHVGAARVAQASTVAALALDASLAQVDPARMLLVDTETTGLQGGAGTLPWVIGLAWFEGEALRVTQLFLGRPGTEGPLLRLLAERVAQASLLVTFNGKCFDWPLLRTRFILNRLRPPAPPAHLDLLHCARRVFKRRLGGTRLQELEAAVLDFHRVGDIPGAQIPAVYFDWLRFGRCGDVERVLEHNAQDLVSMAALLAELCRRFEQVAPEDAPEDCLSLAHLALRGAQPERAEQFALAAIARSSCARVSFDALVLLAHRANRRRDWPSAAQWLERAAALPGLGPQRAAGAQLLLAKVAEHGLKDPSRALRHAQLGAGAESPVANARRIERLSRRLERIPGPDRAELAFG